jgi:predicted RNA-binding Zn-ribbon protein involved in translation (DUF1610 family)
MSDENLFCLECEVLLMRLYDKTELASIPGEKPPPVAGAETYKCPECGKLMMRQANGALADVQT